MSDHPILCGAEPISHQGSNLGVLVIHGFTGSPASVRPIADHLVAHGYSVEAPRLAGHGTHVNDMLETGWADWTMSASEALERLAARTERRIVVGLSMGGSLALWLAARQAMNAGRSDRFEGLVCINPKVVSDDPEIRGMAQDMVDEGDVIIPGSGNDIAKPGVTDIGYSGTPLPPALSLWDGLDNLAPLLAHCTLPLLLMTSLQDHVVPPSDSEHLASVWTGPVERYNLERSFHVATLDFDAGIVLAETLAFCDRILGRVTSPQGDGRRPTSAR